MTLQDAIVIARSYFPDPDSRVWLSDDEQSLFFTVLGGICVAQVVLMFVLGPLISGTTKKDGRGIPRAHAVAFCLVGYVPVLYLNYVAFATANEYWTTTEFDTAEKRIHADNVHLNGFAFRSVSVVMCAYQIYNTLISVFLSDYRTIEAFVHHIATGTLAVLALQPFCGYYGFYYFCFTEVTNLSLYLVDLFRAAPQWAEKFPGFNKLCRIVFALSFIVIRMIMWPYITYHFWFDVVDVGLDRMYWTSLSFLTANVLLTILQLFWGIKIIRLMTKMLFGGGKPKSKKA